VAAEKRTALPASAAESLFESKLHPPPLRSSIIPRVALVDRLDDARDVPIASVVAPAGYGKTTLLSEWAHRDGTRIAWLSIDRHDNDLNQFVVYAAAALDRLEPIDPSIVGPQTRRQSVATAAARMVAAMASMREGVTLVLDHVEALENQECLDTVAELALHLPPGARLALAARADPPLPIPRLRARGEIVEIGVDDLALDKEQSLRLLIEAGIEAADRTVDAVIERSEGWPVGLYLAALALKTGGRGAAASISFSGDDRLVAEYLRSELLEHLSDDEVRFLTRTSVLERLSGPLCDAVLETTGSTDVLGSLSHANLLLIALDRRGEWYRYHHLFRDLLRAELERREPERVPALHVRASDWFDDHGLPERAIDHARQGGDADRMNQLMLTSGGALYARGRARSILGWLGWFDERGLVEEYPALGVLGALLFSGSSHVGDVERWAAAVERPSQATALSTARAQRAALDRILPDGSTLAGWLAVMRLALVRNGVEAMLDDAKIAHQGLGATSEARAAALGFEGLGRYAAGEFDRADALFAHTYSVAVDSLRIPAAVIAAGMRGLLAVRRSDWAGANERRSEALELIETWALDDYAESAPSFVLAARVAIHDGASATAAEFLGRATRLRPLLHYGRPHSSVATLLELARAYTDLGDVAGAREVIRQARGVLQQRPDLGTLPVDVDALVARLDTMHAGAVGASSLTTAELRLVPYLPTHLTFREVAQRLHVSHNTAKTQAISIYQKLGVSSRSAAVEQLRVLALLDG
jgi:LuxR family maltose regulon positive regulatory protein